MKRTEHRAQSAVTALLLAVIALLIPALGQAQRPAFAPTLFWESGLINAPAAYVAPLGGDLAMNFVRIGFDSASLPARVKSTGGYNLSFATSIYGRAEVGVSLFTSDLKNGLFGKVLLWNQVDGVWLRDLRHWLPSIALGVRNLGSQKEMTRLAINGVGNFETAPSFYGVATRSFVLSAGESQLRPKAQLSVTAGMGNGLFSDDGDLGEYYSANSTGGVFGGVSLDFATGRFSTLSLIAEHDGWGVNVGAQAELRGIRFSVNAMELGSSTPAAGSGAYAGQRVAIGLGWQTNLLALIRGNRLETNAQRMQAAQGDLARQVAISQQTIESLEGQLEGLRAISAQGRATERAELERRLREEQEALKRLQEMMKARDAAAKKPPEGD